MMRRKKLETLLQPACFITDPNAMWLPSHSNMMMSVTWQRCLLDMHYKCAVNIKYVFRVKGKASQTCKRAQMRWRLTAVCVSAKKWRSVRETRSRHTNCSYMIKQHFSPHPLSQILPLPIENISGKEDGNGLHWQRCGEEKFLSPMGCRRVLPPRLSTDAQANRNKMSRCTSNRRHIYYVQAKFWG